MSNPQLNKGSKHVLESIYKGVRIENELALTFEREEEDDEFLRNPSSILPSPSLQW